MGLDMHMFKRTYVKKWDHIEDDNQFHVTVTRGGEPYPIDPARVIWIIEEVAYWRKFNALHNWFVQNCQDGVDDCKEYYVTDENLNELLQILKKVMDNINQPDEVLDEILATTSGFFFGSTAYDEYYFKEVERTIGIIESLLKEKGGGYYYQSSW